MSSFIAILLFASTVVAAANYPAPKEADVTLKDFKFTSGEKLPELRIHYRTLGEPQHDSTGVLRNTVLILHATTGTGEQFIRPEFAGELFGRGPVQLVEPVTFETVRRREGGAVGVAGTARLFIDPEVPGAEHDTVL